MKVYLNHLDQNRFHSVYQELLVNTPFSYVTPNKYLKNGKKISFEIGKLIVNRLNIPTFNFVADKKYDLIHSCQSIPISKLPYVLDFEHISAMGGWNQKRIDSVFFKFVLKYMLESDRCKKIIPWTKASANSLINFMETKKFSGKIEVVYPTISPQKKVLRNNTKKFVFIFVAYNFFRKGGDEALKAFEIVSKKNKNAEFWIISNITKKNVKLTNDRVKLFGLKNKDEIFKEFYPKANAFLYPSFNDSFGMVFLEAMSFGLPVITIDDFPTKEIIEDGVNGFIIDGYKKRWYDERLMTRPGSNKWETVASWRTLDEKERIVKQLAVKMELLIKNKRLAEKISQNNIEKIESGIFSVKRRNAQLEKIYHSALRSY